MTTPAATTPAAAAAATTSPLSSVPAKSEAPSSTTATTLPVDRTYPIDRTYGVTTATRTFVDHTRATSPNGDAPGAPDRTLVTSFWLPDVPGTYPLVVFAHGYAVTPDFYTPMLERWAAAGYVVAAPTYPILSGIPGGASHVDYEETFADTSFVITSVLALGKDDAVGARVDADRVAVAGHSDGEVIAFGVGFLECCRDPRVRAVIAMAGNLENANNPHVRDTGTPILHVMETGDEYDPYPDSIAWDRANLTTPRWMFTLQGATHVPPYQVPGNPHFELLASVVVDFLDGTLKGHPERLDRIAETVSASQGLASLER
ncbi:MAG: alpha/beta hydrolase family protein [Acidimicrobiia bacterium]